MILHPPFPWLTPLSISVQPQRTVGVELTAIVSLSEDEALVLARSLMAALGVLERRRREEEAR